MNGTSLPPWTIIHGGRATQGELSPTYNIIMQTNSSQHIVNYCEGDLNTNHHDMHSENSSVCGVASQPSWGSIKNNNSQTTAEAPKLTITPKAKNQITTCEAVQEVVMFQCMNFQ